MPWKKVSFSNEDVRNDRHLSLMFEFAKLHVAARAPTDAAIFVARDEDIYYCSPGAVEIAGTLIQRFWWYGVSAADLASLPPGALDEILAMMRSSTRQ